MLKRELYPDGYEVIETFEEVRGVCVCVCEDQVCILERWSWEKCGDQIGRW